MGGNDLLHYLYSNGDMSFADTWAVTSKRGSCGINELNNIPLEEAIIDSVYNDVESSPFGRFDFWDQEEFILAAAHDRQMDPISPTHVASLSHVGTSTLTALVLESCCLKEFELD